MWGGAGRGGPETQFAVVAIFDAAHLSTMVDFKLQAWSAHRTGRSKSLGLVLGNARLLGNRQTYPECLLLSPEVAFFTHKNAQFLCNTRHWEGR